MCDAPLTSEEDLKAFLEDYGNRYEAAKSLEVAEAPVDNLSSLVGKTFDLSEKASV
jgi:hypothetical protein